MSSLSNLTVVQRIALAIAVLGFLSGASTQMTDIFAPFGSAAPGIVKEIVSLSGFVSGILGVILTTLSSQTKQVQTVQAMPGVTSVQVNEQASQALAQLALDQTQPKIDIIPGANAAVAAAAKG